jgi:hypothetical protein
LASFSPEELDEEELRLKIDVTFLLKLGETKG